MLAKSISLIWLAPIENKSMMYTISRWVDCQILSWNWVYEELHTVYRSSYLKAKSFWTNRTSAHDFFDSSVGNDSHFLLYLLFAYAYRLAYVIK